MTARPWPPAEAYLGAVQHPRNFVDEDLRKGKITPTDINGLPTGASGRFGIVFKVQLPRDQIAVKCFTSNVRDRQTRYAAIAAHLKKVRVAALSEFDYRPSGISVDGQMYPVLRMQWVEASSLVAYLHRETRSDELRRFALRWRSLISELRDKGIAHGDLQNGNILVTSYGDLRLIDYDGMYVPSLAGQPANEAGHPNFQHPLRRDQPLGPELDNFSALVIYLSIKAVIADPTLRKQFDEANERILFLQQDYLDPRTSPMFKRLRGSVDGEVRQLTQRLEDCLVLPCEQAPPLEEVLAGRMPVRIPPPRPSAPPQSTRPRTTTTREVKPITEADIDPPYVPSPRRTPPRPPTAPPPAAQLPAPAYRPYVPPRRSSSGAFVNVALVLAALVVLVKVVGWLRERANVLDEPDAAVAVIDARAPERPGIVLGQSSRVVRKDQDARSAAVARIHPGSIVTIESRSADAFRVRLSDGRRGWMTSADVRIVDPSSPAVIVHARYRDLSSSNRPSYRGRIYADVKRSEVLLELTKARDLEVLTTEGDSAVVALPDGTGGRIIGYVATRTTRPPPPPVQDPPIQEPPIENLTAEEIAGLLELGEQEIFKGNYQAALAIAERVLAAGPHGQAATLAVAAACALRSTRRAKAYLAKVPAGGRPHLVEVCRADGVVLE